MTDALKNTRGGKRGANGYEIFIKVIRYLVLTVIAIFLAFPFFLLVSRSFMSEADINAARILPSEFTFKNYVTIFAKNNYLLYTWNTLKVVGCNMVLVPASASICAYSFSRLKWKGREFFFSCVLSTIMIPGTVLQIPLYVMFYNFDWLGSLKPLIIPAAFGGGAINIFLLRQFMRGIPKEMDEAAIIDGAGVFRRYLLILPLCSPILIYIVVGVFAGGWSDFFGPLVYLTERETYTLAVIIYQDSLVSELSGANLKMAAGAFMALFPTLLFVLYQRKLVDGIMVGAVKG
mgnify:CR=1 FL=1